MWDRLSLSARKAFTLRDPRRMQRSRKAGGRNHRAEARGGSILAETPSLLRRREPTLRVATSEEESTKGLPIGIQVIGSPFGEHKVLRVMKELEAEFGGYQPPINFLPEKQS